VSPRVSVIVQSHARPRTMPIAAASVLAQTVRDLELVLVLDGPVEGLRRAAEAIALADDRVRIVERPKGRRHGEETKAEAIAGAAADVIAYCGDDDLWLPWHLETLLPHVEGPAPALAHAPCVQVLADGALRVLPLDLADPRYHHLLLEGENRFGPTNAVHTRSALDGTSGWAVPDDGPADLWLWRQVVVRPDVRLTSVPRLTALSFPTPFRRDTPDAERAAELAAWAERLAAAGGHEALLQAAFAATATDTARCELRSWGEPGDPEWRLPVDELRRQLAGARTRGDAMAAELARAQADIAAERAAVAAEREAARHALAELEGHARAAAARTAELEAAYAAIAGSRTWRLRARIVRSPAGRVLRRR